MTVSRRTETPEDEPFLRKLVLETLASELGANDWPEPMRDHLLQIQYRQRRAAGNGQIILLDGEEAGWIVLANLSDEIRIIEIMVREERRGLGAGSAVIAEIQATAREAGKAVRLGVNAINKDAIRLYRRLGFRETGGDGVQHEMEWTC
jgi:ribosomal protein S18 acetylase RimI-like enzyme